jgi:hypothetical protein
MLGSLCASAEVLDDRIEETGIQSNAEKSRRVFASPLENSCLDMVYLDKQHQEKGKHMPKAKEAVYVGFVPNRSSWALWVLKDKKIMTTNLERSNEHEFPFRKRKMVEQHLSDNSTDILFQLASHVICVLNNKLHVSNYSIKSIMTNELCGRSESGKSEEHIHLSNLEQVSGRL